VIAVATAGSAPRTRGSDSPGTLQIVGSAPRAREAALQRARRPRGRRIGPAWGSPAKSSGTWTSRAQPRVRGEQGEGGRLAAADARISPRGREAAAAGSVAVHPDEISPACAGSRLRCATSAKPCPDQPACAGSRRTHRGSHCRSPDQPRVRGEQYYEDREASVATGSARVRGDQNGGYPDRRVRSGSAPRARGADCPDLEGRSWCGISPAYAGSSPSRLTSSTLPWVQPRVTRGGARQLSLRSRANQISPTCTGNRRRRTGRGPADQPRLRGEQLSTATLGPGLPGSAPLARGTDPAPLRADLEHGISPACAGSRSPLVPAPTNAADQPRACGGDPAFASGLRLRRICSPRMRG
jgi:hypothetical protein